MEQSDSLPVYLTPAISIADYLKETRSLATLEPLCVKIIDFGNCKATLISFIVVCLLWHA